MVEIIAVWLGNYVCSSVTANSYECRETNPMPHDSFNIAGDCIADAHVVGGTVAEGPNICATWVARGATIAPLKLESPTFQHVLEHRHVIAPTTLRPLKPLKPLST